MRRAIGRPSPVPELFVVRNGSNTPARPPARGRVLGRVLAAGPRRRDPRLGRNEGHGSPPAAASAARTAGSGSPPRSCVRAGTIMPAASAIATNFELPEEERLGAGYATL